MIATIYEHGSFVFFIYVCVSCLLGLIGLSDLGVPEFWKGFLIVAFEVSVGAGVTILFIDRFNAHREEENLKQRLIREAGSRSHDIAISAVEWMRREGWLKGNDGLLKGEDLIEANLENSHLGGANLESAELGLANLRGANLWNARLKSARLLQAKLQGAILCMADLRDADLRRAKMKKSDLMQANLGGADLRFANFCKASLKLSNLQRVKLTGANLDGARFDGAFMRDVDIIGVNFRGATMPDQTLAYEDGSDVKKFTDPSHPEFDKALEDVKQVRRDLGLIE